MPHRGQIIHRLSTALAADDAVRAAWLGGSDATGRTDPRSDIDLVAVVHDHAVERGFETAEAALESLAGIDLRLRLPQPTWHTHEQAFYRLRDTPPELLIDFLVMSQSAPPHTRFLEPERHGRPRILFDKDNWVAPIPFDRPAHEQRMLARLQTLRARFELFQPLITKAIARGHTAEAVHFYQGFTLAPLIELLRMRHAPDLYDYGPRYLDRDLPPELRAQIERLSLHADLTQLARHHAEAVALFRTTSNQLSDR
jgi:predicted nucleotidyltransferase